jgi:hypothetical protein
LWVFVAFVTRKPDTKVITDHEVHEELMWISAEDIDGEIEKRLVSTNRSLKK